MTRTERSRRPQRVIAVAATNRSGSTLLCRALAATGEFGTPPELVNPHEVITRDALRRRPLHTIGLGCSLLARWRQPGQKWEKVHRYTPSGARRLLDAAPSRWGSTDGTLTFKLMWHPYRIALLENGLDVHYWGVPVHWVRIQRHDRLRQAISYAKATASSQWSSEQRPLAVPQFDRAAIESRLRDLDDSEEHWDRYFERIGVTPYPVTYEELDGEYEAVIRALLDHLGRPDLAVPARQLQRQADRSTEEWVARYLNGD